MLDFSAYLAAQQLTREAVNVSLSDAPVRPARVPLERRPGAVAARQRIGLTLRRLAEVIQPMPERADWVLQAGR